jgi:hypothetical protein
MIPLLVAGQEMPRQADSLKADPPPAAIVDPATKGFALRPVQKQFAIGLKQLLPSATLASDPSGWGLRLDLGDSTLYGKVFAGQAYFDETLSSYPETRYRTSGEIVRGKATIAMKTYFDEGARSNANKWTDRGVLGYRLDLLRIVEGKPVHAGIYDSRVHFRKMDSLIVPIVSIVQPPMIGCVQSDHPEWCLMTFTTDRRSFGFVEIKGGGVFSDGALQERHEVVLGGLRPSTSYKYRVLTVAGKDTASTPWLSFRSAPRKGEGSVAFAYAGDGRASTGGGEYEYAGVNRQVGSLIARQVFEKGASFLLFGGDLIAGYTNSRDEFRMELMAFREAYGPLLQGIPLYSAIGNHESLLNFYADGSRRGFGMDMWPYASRSTEAVFAGEFLQPTNGPRSGAGRPPYTESVFSFQYGPVKLIVANNNYWFTAHNRIAEFGGSPEGYILPDEMEWIKKELDAAEKDPTVAHVVLMAQEPAFPGGGHVADAMWHGGNNNRRAYEIKAGKPVPLGPGMVDMRNELWTLVSTRKKVALMLGSDEHNYQRYLIDRNTPVGIPLKDDKNGNGILDDGVISPNPAFRYPTWFVTSGGAGAPYYTQEEAPWSGSSKFFSPQANFIIFRADKKKIAMEVYNTSGQLLDRVEDLRAARR